MNVQCLWCKGFKFENDVCLTCNHKMGTRQMRILCEWCLVDCVPSGQFCPSCGKDLETAPESRTPLQELPRQHYFRRQAMEKPQAGSIFDDGRPQAPPSAARRLGLSPLPKDQPTAILQSTHAVEQRLGDQQFDLMMKLQVLQQHVQSRANQQQQQQHQQQHFLCKWCKGKRFDGDTCASCGHKADAGPMKTKCEWCDTENFRTGNSDPNCVYCGHDLESAPSHPSERIVRPQDVERKMGATVQSSDLMMKLQGLQQQVQSRANQQQQYQHFECKWCKGKRLDGDTCACCGHKIDATGPMKTKCEWCSTENFRTGNSDPNCISCGRDLESSPVPMSQPPMQQPSFLSPTLVNHPSQPAKPPSRPAKSAPMSHVSSTSPRIHSSKK